MHSPPLAMRALVLVEMKRSRHLLRRGLKVLGVLFVLGIVTGWPGATGPSWVLLTGAFVCLAATSMNPLHDKLDGTLEFLRTLPVHERIHVWSRVLGGLPYALLAIALIAAAVAMPEAAPVRAAVGPTGWVGAAVALITLYLIASVSIMALTFAFEPGTAVWTVLAPLLLSALASEIRPELEPAVGRWLVAIATDPVARLTTQAVLLLLLVVVVLGGVELAAWGIRRYQPREQVLP